MTTKKLYKGDYRLELKTKPVPIVDRTVELDKDMDKAIVKKMIIREFFLDILEKKQSDTLGAVTSMIGAINGKKIDFQFKTPEELEEKIELIAKSFSLKVTRQ